MTDLKAAMEALADVGETQGRLADRARCPAYMHALFGGLYGVIVAAQAGSAAITISVEFVALAAAVAMFLLNKKRLGFFVNGYRKGRTRPVVGALLLAFFVCMGLALWFKVAVHMTWPILALGGVMFLVGTWTSIAWQRIYISELGASSAARR